LPEDQEELRGNDSPFRRTPLWVANTTNRTLTDQPRALRSLSQIINDGLCHRCGSCVGICPTQVLGINDDAYPTVLNLSACTDCDLCVKVCPGDEFNYKEAHQTIFNCEPDLTDTHGKFNSSILAYATDIEVRSGSTSGGLITALLIDMLKSGEIDGAVSIVSDETTLWKGRPIIARSEAELKNAMKSKYAISPTNQVFSEIRQIPGRYAFVGLPCQIHGLAKATELDKNIRERIVLSIALFCHAAIDHEAFRVIWDTLPIDKRNRATGFVSRLEKHPGSPNLILDNGSHYPIYFGNHRGYRPTSIEMINILYRLYTPERCLTCFDALGELADISVGDPWLAPPTDDIDFHDGWSFALIRTERGQQALANATNRNSLHTHQLSTAEAKPCNALMATEKRWRAYRILETRRRQGKPIPEYHMPTPTHSVEHFIKTELNVFSHILCGLPKLQAPALRFMLSSYGYYLLWLNSIRRRTKVWWRDAKVRWKRRW
jgi:coenzyme F420 hydrogenase subunit beta